MSRFLIEIISLLGLISILCIAGEIALQINYQTPSDVHQDWHLLADKGAEIIIVGHSRAINHCVPSIINERNSMSTQIIGSNGWTAPLILLKLKTYLESTPCPKPRTLLFTVDPIIFGEGSGDWYAKTRDLKYLFGDPYGIQNLNSNLNGHNFLDEYLPLFRYFGDPNRFVRDLFGIRDNIETQNGYIPRTDNWTGEFKYDGGYWGTSYDVTTNAMEELIKLKNTHDLDVILFESPFSLPSREHTKSTRLMLDSISPFPFWSWNWNSTEWNDSTLFSNHSHLNAAGSEIFSIQLSDSIQEYLNKCSSAALRQSRSQK